MFGKLGILLSCLVMALTPPNLTVAQEQTGPSKQEIAKLADFAGRVNELQSISDNIVFTGGLALLSKCKPDWEFEAVGKNWTAAKNSISDDVKAVVAHYEYGMHKRRGPIARNLHRDRMLTLKSEIKDGVKALTDELNLKIKLAPI